MKFGVVEYPYKLGHLFGFLPARLRVQRIKYEAKIHYLHKNIFLYACRFVWFDQYIVHYFYFTESLPS
jgi:hypothetical protein